MNQVIDPADAEALDAIPVGEGPGRAIGIAVAWIAVGLVVGLALWFFWTKVVDPTESSAVDSFAAGKGGQLYASARAGFKVEMPTTPIRRESGGVVIVDSQPSPGYSFSVTREAQPETALENYVVTLNTAAGSLAAQNGGEIVKQGDPVPFNNVAVKSIVFRKGNEYYRNMLLLSTNKLYTIQAKIKGSNEAPFHQLWKSFSVLGGS